MGHYDSCRDGYCARCGAAPGNFINGRCQFCHPVAERKPALKLPKLSFLKDNPLWADYIRDKSGKLPGKK